MQRATANRKSLLGAISFGLTLPFSIAMAQPVAMDAPPFADSPIEAWRDYAVAAITPRFDWAEAGGLSPPSLLDRTLRRRERRIAGVEFSGSALSLSIADGLVNQHAAVVHDGSDGTPALLPRHGLERTLISPAYTHSVGDDGHWSVGAVLAYQRFATVGFGATDGMLPVVAQTQDEVSYGQGVRIDAGYSLGRLATWTFGYQSRVNMDAFNRYRGMYAEPGDFDIPASVNAGFSMALAPQFELGLGVERVMYHEARPFTSAALPRRFLAVLGDGTSPVFAWRDLTVYSVTGAWRSDDLGELALRYSTREQPSPTSRLLDRLLNDGQADYSVEARYSKRFDANSRLQFSASYTPYEYILGAPTSYSVRNDIRGRQVEFEALLAFAF